MNREQIKSKQCQLRSKITVMDLEEQNNGFLGKRLFGV